MDGGHRGLGVVWSSGIWMTSVVPGLSSAAVDPGMITGVCHGRWAREVMKRQISAGRSGTASAFWCAASGAYLLFLI